ncbi:MAG: acetate--CoA ligase [Candidatus Caenarcaniphilales bacterium]|nr:acetate--CoA ligase [Candidatus Caenarcaniphilales bacterium]
MSEVLSESPIYPPKENVKPISQISSLDEYKNLYNFSINHPEEFWAEQAKRLTWFHPWENVLDDDFSEADVAWFSGGKLNVSHNCIDRHLKDKAEKIALIWETDEPGEAKTYTYSQLKHEVCRIANVLKASGVKKGDCVCLYMPMMPELVFSMLACARIGAIHSVVFAGFSAESLRDRIIDCGCKVIVTANESKRGGRCYPLKNIVDKAIQGLTLVEKVFVAKRTLTEIEMQPGRDLWLHEEVQKERRSCPAEWMSSEDPLFILYTSGSTGKPKGLMHTQAGYLLYASMTFEYVFNYHPKDIYFCAADIGWITGHTYLVYGPLSVGATTVLFESTPLYPDPGRYWEVIEKHKVNIFYTSPTAIRAVARFGKDYPAKYDLSSLRVLGSVGEPINPEAWKWFYETIGRGECTLVDTWWQTETGGIMITPLPGVTDMKPGSATLPFFGVNPCLVDDNGLELTENNTNGNLCIKKPWPGMARSIYGDHQRYVETYFTQYPGLYFTGDGCKRDEDGFYWISGRIDDVINVSGHRLGTAEIESSLTSNPLVAEAAVIGIPHQIKGMGICAFIVPSVEASSFSVDEISGTIKQQLRNDIGAFALPDQLQIVKGLPKTRSGKIMRRILRQIAIGEHEDLGNLSTLAEPNVVDDLIKQLKTR